MRLWVPGLFLVTLLCTPASAAGWKTVKTRHYDIYTDLSDTREVRQVQLFLEAMHWSYRGIFKSAPVRDRGRAKVRLFAQKADYIAFGTQPGAPGFNRNWRGHYSSDSNEVVSYRGPTMPELYSILSHEGFHQFAWEYIIPKGAEQLPRWFDEGLGEYFRSSIVKKGRLQRMPLLGHTQRIKRAESAGQLWSLEEILGSDPARIKDKSRFSTFYSYAYMFVNFLIDRSKKSLKKIYSLKKQGKRNNEILAIVFPERKRALLYSAFRAYVKAAR